MSDKDKALVPVIEPVGTKAEDFRTEHPEDPAVGKWYWVKETKRVQIEDEDEESGYREGDVEEETRWLGCVIRMGSNYAALEGIKEGYSTTTERVHLDHFFDYCTYEPDADIVINGEVARRQQHVNALMGKVIDITRRLAISPDTHMLPSGSETRALATIGGGGQPIEDYKTSLVHAKDEELPDLFGKIKNENENLSHWMSAKLIPLQAQANGLKPAIEAIQHRLFSVELYAGLQEQVEEIKSGEPAGLTEKIHIFQRCCYMDEECLAQYEAGGMEFEDIRAFDKWITRPSNLERLLPYPRTIVAFRVRRYTKERHPGNLNELFRMMDDAKADKYTYLYMRNGDRVYRMRTSIEFGHDLFPDADQHILKSGGPLWASRFEQLISNNEYLGMKEKYEAKVKEYETWDEKTKRVRGKPRARHEKYSLFNRDNLYYDDIAKKLAEEADEHNRLVLVLQGLLDRSPVMHPHPAWSLWDTGGFGQALQLIYDNSRAMTTGDKPDFEAYRAKLNASIIVGSITIGQDLLWAEEEAAKEDGRRRERGDRYGYDRDYYRPSGNPGPGVLAYVTKVNKKAGTVTYEWNRCRRGHEYDSGEEKDLTKLVACKFTTKIENVLNASAYKPNDFKQFFSDPRTRADYLQWAYFLLNAEEYAAGNREVAKARLAPPKPRTGEGSHEYRLRKRNKAIVGKAVRLRASITTTKETKYARGTLFRVIALSRRTFTIQLLNDDGTGDFAPGYKEKSGDWEFDRWHRVGKVSFYDLVIDPTVPAEKKP